MNCPECGNHLHALEYRTYSRYTLKNVKYCPQCNIIYEIKDNQLTNKITGNQLTKKRK